VAGAQGRIHFTDRAIAKIHQESGGVPRLISLIADRTLLAGYVAQTMKLGTKHVEQGLASLRGEGGGRTAAPPRLSSPRWRWLRPFTLTLTALGLLAGLGAVAAWYAGGIP
jgi:hypothetical protein